MRTDTTSTPDSDRDLHLTPLLQTPEFQMLLGDAPTKTTKQKYEQDDEQNMRQINIGKRGSSAPFARDKSSLYDTSASDFLESEGYDRFFHGYGSAVNAAMDAGQIENPKYKMVPNTVVITKKKDHGYEEQEQANNLPPDNHAYKDDLGLKQGDNLKI